MAESATDAAYAQLERAWHVSEYATALYQATGFAFRLVLHPQTEARAPHTQPANLFCHLLTQLLGPRAPCSQAHLKLRQRTGGTHDAERIHCPMGLNEVAVPVIVDGRHIATLYGGQVLRKRPRPEQFAPLARRLARCGLSAKEVRRLRAAYFHTPLLTKQQYRAAISMLTIFARQLAESANSWIVTGHLHELAAVTQAKAFIHAHLTEPLTTGAVAAHVRLSADRFSRLFKQATSLTVADYVNRVRVERVKRLLAYPDTRIGEAALAAGFGDIGYFNRTFKRCTGQSPKQYRASLTRAIPKLDKKTPSQS